MRRFTVAVNDNAAERLTALARAKRRDPRQQAALILERALARVSRQADSGPGSAQARAWHTAAPATDGYLGEHGE